MSGAGSILAINLVVAGLLAASFVMIAIFDRMRTAPRWLAFCYALGMSSYAVEALVPLTVDSRYIVTLSFGLVLAAMVAFNVGVARKYAVSAPWWLMAAVFLLSNLAVFLSQDLPRHSFERMMIYQAPYSIMQAIAVGLILSPPKRRKIDWAFTVLLCLSSLHFLAKPFIAHALGGWGTNPQAYLQTSYAMISMGLGTIFGIGVALMTLVVLVHGLLLDLTMKSETDTLSGLLNRRGFEQRAARALSGAAGQRMPVSLVIADLDHFKSINDNYGHAMGDRVIAAFAGFLRNVADDHHVAGRIGGEEFAIILPGANLAAARLFAEGARGAFAAISIDGFPKDRRFTASFGVAELAQGENISELLVRADAALYAAKDEGRDCVRIARPSRLQPLRSAG
jgi:diguanylate cyclase (GGDEF)-like protein